MVALLAEEGYRPVNCDITVVAERPKIGPYVQAMRERISAVLDVEPRRVSIKATTNERMGFVGREAGHGGLRGGSHRRALIHPPA